MAKHYLKNPFVSVDGHDISVYVKSVEVDRKKDELDTTASGDGGHTQIPGLSKDSFTLNLYQDKDFSILDRILADIYEAETAVVVEACEQGSVVSESNPSFTGNAKIYEHKPFSGDVGTLSMTPIVLVVDGAITRSGT
jgi:hypothetical protein